VQYLYLYLPPFTFGEGKDGFTGGGGGDSVDIYRGLGRVGDFFKREQECGKKESGWEDQVSHPPMA